MGKSLHGPLFSISKLMALLLNIGSWAMLVYLPEAFRPMGLVTLIASGLLYFWDELKIAAARRNKRAHGTAAQPAPRGK